MYSFPIESSENDIVFGSSNLLDKGTYDSVKRCTEDNYKNSYIYLDKYYYSVFKFDKILEAPMLRLNDSSLYLRSGNSTTLSISCSKEITDSAEKNLKNTFTNTSSYNIKANVDVSVLFDASADLSQEIINSVESNVSFSHAYKTTIGETYSVSVNPRNYDTWWFLESRARYNVYRVFVYEIQYEQKITTKKTWYGKKYHTFTYEKTGYKLIENPYIYSTIDGSLATGIYEYIPNSNGTYTFNGDRFEWYTYLD